MKDLHQIPSASEFGQLRSYLAKNKFSQSWIASVIGTNHGGKTRDEIVSLLKTAMRNLPKTNAQPAVNRQLNL